MADKKLRKNELFIAKIEDITNLGFGVARYCGRVVFVSDAVTGDTVEVRIIKVSASYCVGRIERFISYSEHRAFDRCHISRCKSCAYKSIHPSVEGEAKENFVKNEFKKHGLSDIGVMNLVSSPRELGYRNKAQYPITRSNDGRIKIGFFAPKTHNVADATDCPLSPPVFSEILNSLRTFFEKNAISVYDEKSGKGLLRHIYLRQGEISGEILLTLVINGDSIPFAQELCQSLTEKYVQLVGILLNENRKSTNVILGERYITLFGRDYIYDTLAGVKLKLSAPSFYQVNHGTAELIYKRARELAALKKTDTLLDLFCGTGSIGLSMAADAHRVIGIEIVPDAVECARENAAANGINNAIFFAGDATDSERLLSQAEVALGESIRPDVIILDPPRAGCDDKLLGYVCRLLPKRIVYISCNPTTLARDIKAMLELGYITDTVEPFDMFPMTGHVESVVCLTRTFDN